MKWFDFIFASSGEPLLFHSGYFLCIFAVFMICYAFVFDQKKYRDILIIGFGLYFYEKSSGALTLLLVGCVLADYAFSWWIHRSTNPFKRKFCLVMGILFSLSFLLYFKYSVFFLENWSALVGGIDKPEHLILPIGISFYTFQSISYLVDIYQKKIRPSTFRDYIFYMTFFPHLVAGPIVRASNFIPQIRKKVFLGRLEVGEALYLISKGLVKKAIIADFIGQYVDTVFSAPDGFSGTEHLVAVLCYSLQIFCDFSGYTDMAIGIALLLGFRLGVNFDAPYKALNITDFWRRWHISLSSWLRDYIYIPLGGNQKGLGLQLLFLLMTMLIGGFWHGASWKFVFWGAGHGILLCIHKLFVMKFPQKIQGTTWAAFSGVLTFVCVALLWVPFRAEHMGDVWVIYQKIFSQQELFYVSAIVQANPILVTLLLAGFMGTLLPEKYKLAIRDKYTDTDFVLKLAGMAVLIQILLQVQATSVQPFIYFQF